MPDPPTPEEAKDSIEIKLAAINETIAVLKKKDQDGEFDRTIDLIRDILKWKLEIISLLRYILHKDFPIWYDGLSNMDDIIGILIRRGYKIPDRSTGTTAQWIKLLEDEKKMLEGVLVN